VTGKRYPAKELLNRLKKHGKQSRLSPGRRALPTLLTQGFQLIIQKRLIARVLATTERVELPKPLCLMLQSKFLSRIRGRVVGIGFRPEHVKTPISNTGG